MLNVVVVLAVGDNVSELFARVAALLFEKSARASMSHSNNTSSHTTQISSHVFTLGQLSSSPLLSPLSLSPLSSLRSPSPFSCYRLIFLLSSSMPAKAFDTLFVSSRTDPTSAKSSSAATNTTQKKCCLQRVFPPFLFYLPLLRSLNRHPGDTICMCTINVYYFPQNKSLFFVVSVGHIFLLLLLRKK